MYQCVKAFPPIFPLLGKVLEFLVGSATGVVSPTRGIVGLESICDYYDGDFTMGKDTS